MKRSTLVIALTLVFLSGIVVGAVAYRLYTARSAAAVERRPSPEEFRQRYVGMMKSRLNLSEDQLAQLNAILDETRELFKRLEEKSRTERQALRERQVEMINAILNETQRLEYAQIRREREERRKQREKLHGPPHSPGR